MDNSDKAGKYIQGSLKGEVVTLGIGGTGIQQAASFYSAITNENKSINDNIKSLTYDIIANPQIFINKSPRAVIVDVGEESYLNWSKNPNVSALDKSFCVYNKESSEGIFAVKNLHQPLIDATMEAVRKQVEACGALGSFQSFMNIGGGVGSGIGSEVIAKLKEAYPKSAICSYLTMPSFPEDSTYRKQINSLCGISALFDCSDINILIKEDSLRKAVKVNKVKEEDTKYTYKNYLVGKLVADITSPMRFKGSESLTYRKLEQLLVPYRGLTFVNPFLIPKIPEDFNEKNIISGLFSSYNGLGISETTEGLMLSNYSIIRGSFKTTLLENAIDMCYLRKRDINSVEFSGNNLFYNLLKVTGVGLESAALLSSSTNFRIQLSSLNNCFDIAYSGQSGEEQEEEGVEQDMPRERGEYFLKSIKLGIEEGQFSEYRENMAAKEMDYQFN